MTQIANNNNNNKIFHALYKSIDMQNIPKEMKLHFIPRSIKVNHRHSAKEPDS